MKLFDWRMVVCSFYCSKPGFSTHRLAVGLDSTPLCCPVTRNKHNNTTVYITTLQYSTTACSNTALYTYTILHVVYSVHAIPGVLNIQLLRLC